MNSRSLDLGSGSVSRGVPLGEGPKLLGRMTLAPRPKGRRGKRTHYLALAVSLCTLLLLAMTTAGCRGRQQPRQRQAGAAPPGAGAPAGRGATPQENLACQLLTRDDAEALLGGPVLEPPVTSSMADIGVVSWRCGYISAAKNPTKVVTLLANRWQEPGGVRRAFEHAHTLSQTISGQVPENVDGLGDRAYWSGGKVNQLNVLRGRDWLVISGTAGPGLDQLAPAKAAAAKILAHH